jgi:hypothetical protein
MLIIDCSTGTLLYTVGYSITGEGINQGKDGQGIFEATLICALSSICAKRLDLIRDNASLLFSPTIFMLFSKWKGVSLGYFLTTVQETTDRRQIKRKTDLYGVVLYNCINLK